MKVIAFNLKETFNKEFFENPPPAAKHFAAHL
jgi:hypothetical protein